MNPDDRSQLRRRRGTYAAVLSAAAGAVLAAAIIPAAAAFADTTDDAVAARAVGPTEAQTDADYQTYFAPNDVVTGDTSGFETHINGFLGLIGNVNTSWESQMEGDLESTFTNFGTPTVDGGSVANVDPQFTTFLVDADLSNYVPTAVPALNALIDNDIIGGASGPDGTALELDLATIFTNFDFGSVGAASTGTGELGILDSLLTSDGASSVAVTGVNELFSHLPAVFQTGLETDAVSFLTADPGAVNLLDFLAGL